MKIRITTSLLPVFASVMVMASAPCRGGDDSKPLSGRIFVKLVPEADPRIAGIAEINPKDGTWKILFDEPVGLASVSPDGRHIAYFRRDEQQNFSIVLRNLEANGEPKRVGSGKASFAWSPNSQELMISRARDRGYQPLETFRVKADGTDRKPVPIAETDSVRDWSPDGQWILLWDLTEFGKSESSILVVRPDGTGRKLIAKLGTEFRFRRFCPDQRGILGMQKEDSRFSLAVATPASGSVRVLVPGADKSYPLSACPSPDGSWVAYSFTETESVQEGYLEVIRVDGSGRRRIDLPAHTSFVFDWR